MTFGTDEGQVADLRIHTRAFEDGPQSVARVIREAISEYLAAHATERQVLKWKPMSQVVRRPPKRTGKRKARPRITLQLKDRKRLEKLRLQARASKGTRKSVGGVICVAIDEYLEAHKEELREFLRQKRRLLGEELFPIWKQNVMCRSRQEGIDGGRQRRRRRVRRQAAEKRRQP